MIDRYLGSWASTSAAEFTRATELTFENNERESIQHAYLFTVLSLSRALIAPAPAAWSHNAQHPYLLPYLITKIL